MREKRFQVNSLWKMLFALTLLFFLGTPVRAQSSSAQNNKPVQDNDATRPELAQFDQFLNSHMEIAEQLRKNPSLVNDKGFVKNHPVLQTYLQEHPGIREELKENPNAFMRQGDRFDRHEDARDNSVTRGEMAQFNQFLEGHREIAEQIRKDPSLVNNEEFVEHHQALQSYLQDHPGVREEFKTNPNAFMRQEDRFDRHEDARDTDSAHRDYDSARRDDDATRPGNDTARRDNDATRTDNDTARRDNDAARNDENTARRDDDTNRKGQARFNQFAESHREIAEQLRKDPSLVNNKQFVDNHPALQAFLQEQPDVRDQMKTNPNAFMTQENRFDRQEGSGTGDTSRAHLPVLGNSWEATPTLLKKCPRILPWSRSTSMSIATPTFKII